MLGESGKDGAEGCRNAVSGNLVDSRVLLLECVRVHYENLLVPLLGCRNES